METTTKKITSKLRADIENQIEPILESLRKAGKTDKELQNIVISHFRAKLRQEYNKLKEAKPLGSILDGLFQQLADIGPDSKAEWLFHEMLKDNHIPFRYHYQIGPYVADYLVDKALVVELDGSQHKKQEEHDKKRDNYMQRLGYSVLRIPLNFFILDSKAVIGAVNEARNLP